MAQSTGSDGGAFAKQEIGSVGFRIHSNVVKHRQDAHTPAHSPRQKRPESPQASHHATPHPMCDGQALTYACPPAVDPRKQTHGEARLFNGCLATNRVRVSQNRSQGQLLDVVDEEVEYAYASYSFNVG